MAFKRILVPVDLSGRNRRALAIAASLARQSGGRVTVLHVIQRIEHLSGGELRRFYSRLAGLARRRLAPLVRSTAGDVDARLLTVIGDPPYEIIRHAAARGTDLIVLGSHKVRPGRRATGWGTTSYKVGVLCQCPVLLVK